MGWDGVAWGGVAVSILSRPLERTAFTDTNTVENRLES